MFLQLFTVFYCTNYGIQLGLKIAYLDCTVHLTGNALQINRGCGHPKNSRSLFLWSSVIKFRHHQRIGMFLNSMVTLIQNEKMYAFHFYNAVSKNIQQYLGCHN
uniref:Uncharacterized protein n=1 Tax=Opuntia streptacantha TaxID=393608 RepID=A0A7C8YEW7_OPUST